MVNIIPYQETWPSEFQEIASQLRQSLGRLALRIDHIGSTSVPGSPAKDVIDIQITVAALEEHVISALMTLGYTQPEEVWRDHHPPRFLGPETEWEKWLFRPPPDQRPTHTHVRVLGRANQRYALLFRDYLRTHPASAEAYAGKKSRDHADMKKGEAYEHRYKDIRRPSRRASLH